MSRDEFNRDMGDYLRRRRVVQRTNPLEATRKFFTRTFGFGETKRKQTPEEHVDIPAEQIEAVLVQDAIKRRSGARKTAAPVRPAARAATPKQQERGTMSWLFGKKKQEDEEYEMAEVAAQPAVDEDVKEVLKITFKWLKMMDPESVEQIKASQDFEKYKAVLDKYGLIKK